MRKLSIGRRLLFEFYFLSMPCHAWMIRGRKVRSRYFDLRNSEYATKAELRALQSERLREIVSHHYRTSGFFRKRLDEQGIEPSQICSVDDLERLPLLSKEDVKTNMPRNLISSGVSANEISKISTSGSTGQPFTIYVDRSQLEIRFAATLRALEWTGWKFGDRQVRLWHQTIGMSKTQIIRERIDAALMRRKFIPAFEISTQNIEKLVASIRRHRPVLIDGYAESLNFLSKYLQSGRSVGFSPGAVMSSAQALPASTRAVIETQLKTKVFDKYGSREFSGIAYECEMHGAHHVVDECYIVELLVNGRRALPGEIGEVVVTDLFNRAVPMIRYRIGDLALAVPEEPFCGCGRAHSRIGDIEGRTQAIVHCANGVWQPGSFFLHFFKEHEDLIQFFQIEQKVRGEFILRIVQGPRFSSVGLDDLLASLRQYIGDTKVEVIFTENIPLTKTGKRSPIVSSVVADFQGLDAITKHIGNSY